MEVFAEQGTRHALLEVVVSRDDDAHGHPDRGLGAQPVELPFG
jgi:hypothetical protein